MICAVELNALAAQVLGGRPELFAADFEERCGAISAELAGRSVLVIGAGGSIGRATAEILLSLRPKRTLLVDLSENNLAEITRRLRNAFPTNAPDFEAWALDFTGAPFEALLGRERPDIVLNFAAFKHVRSEKDTLTLAELLRVNVLGNLRLLRWASAHGRPTRIFAISTDKAANPASCMGASKRLMEQLLWAAAQATPPAATLLTSTRFANVLFSDGSLPASWLARLEQRQPLAAPGDVRRYFITPREAGMLCLLAAFHPASCELLVPRMRDADLQSFDTLAVRLLAHRKLIARDYGEDTAAAFANLERDAAEGYWPCLFGSADTSGEKDFEEFAEPGETDAAGQPYHDARCLLPKREHSWEELGSALDALARDCADVAWLQATPKAALVARLAQLVPSFAHIETGYQLDRKV